MKFVIEIYAAVPDGSETLLHQATITAINPATARKQAATLLASRKKGTRARILNGQGEIIYEIE